MKFLLPVFMALFFVPTFSMTEAEFLTAVKGKSISGDSIESVKTTFTFSNDGKTATLKKLGGFKHKFVKMVGDIAVYEGKRGGNVHYDAFQISGSTVNVTSGDQIGGVKLSGKNNTPENMAKALKKSSLKFTFVK